MIGGFYLHLCNLYRYYEFCSYPCWCLSNNNIKVVRCLIIIMNLPMKVVFPMGAGEGITRTFVILFWFTFSLVPFCYCIWVVMWYKMIMTNELFSLCFSLTRACHMTYFWEAKIRPTSTPCWGGRDRVHVTLKTPLTASSLLVRLLYLILQWRSVHLYSHFFCRGFILYVCYLHFTYAGSNSNSISDYVPVVTWWVWLVEQVLLTHPEHLHWPSVLSVVRGAISLLFYIMFCRSWFVLLSFFTIVLSVDLWFEASGYAFSMCKFNIIIIISIDQRASPQYHLITHAPVINIWNNDHLTMY